MDCFFFSPIKDSLLNKQSDFFNFFNNEHNLYNWNIVSFNHMLFKYLYKSLLAEFWKSWNYLTCYVFYRAPTKASDFPDLGVCKEHLCRYKLAHTYDSLLGWILCPIIIHKFLYFTRWCSSSKSLIDTHSFISTGWHLLWPWSQFPNYQSGKIYFIFLKQTYSKHVGFCVALALRIVWCNGLCLKSKHFLTRQLPFLTLLTSLSLFNF